MVVAVTVCHTKFDELLLYIISIVVVVVVLSSRYRVILFGLSVLSVKALCY